MSKKSIFIFFLGFITAGVPALAVILSHHAVSSETAAISPKFLTARPEPVPATLTAKPTISNISSTSIAKPQSAIEETHSPVETEAWKTFLSPKPDLNSIVHQVKSGDNLTNLSKKYHVTVDWIRRSNNLLSDKLTLGEKLKISTYKLSIVIDKSQNTLILKGNEELLKTYTVSTGSNNSTPVGVFKITDKLIHPTWYKPDGKVIPYGSPENLLGTRWMGLTKEGYGIHGTLKPEKLGQQITDGCIRMRNEEVEELYGIITPGTEVTIVD